MTRKVIKTQGSFPSEEAALKLLYLALKSVRKRWQATRDWKSALNHFTLIWGERIEAAWQRSARQQVRALRAKTRRSGPRPCYRILGDSAQRSRLKILTIGKRQSHKILDTLGFSERNLGQMRLFYLTWQNPQTAAAQSIAKLISQTPSAKSGGWPQFALPWSHYVRLLTVSDLEAREFYEQEAFRGGWSVRQLDRQIATRTYERTGRSRTISTEEKSHHPNDHVRDTFVLEFLNLKDEYSESELEDALVQSLEAFLLELGNDFAFVARQKRMRVGNAWCRVDLVFFHRLLRCLVIVDLKLGSFTHADAGQMNLCLNYTREHWTHPHENPPVGLILCSEKDAAVAHYALGNLSNQTRLGSSEK